MRWPNRTPHVLTPGMRLAQRALADFLPLIDWRRFDRRSVGPDVVVRDAAGATVDEGALARFGCASRDQAVVYLLARDRLAARGLMRGDVPPLELTLEVPDLVDGRYRVTGWNTAMGHPVAAPTEQAKETGFALPPFVGDLAVALSRRDG